MKLTARIIASITLPPDKNDVIVFDEDLAGFGYRLTRSGKRVRKSFIIQYRNAVRRMRRLNIGSGELPIAAARKTAVELLAKVKLGGDPQGEKAAARERSVLGFRAMAEDFIADRQASWRPSTVRQYRHMLLVCCKSLHNKLIDEITRADISSLIKHIETERGLRTAALLRDRLSMLFTWAMREGRIEKNPVLGTREVPYKASRERVLSDDEIAHVWRLACNPEVFPYGGHFGHILRLLLLTGARRQEVACMAWSELDARGNWTIPAERSKNKRTHTLPLPPAAITIIEEMRIEGMRSRRPGGDYVFNTRSGMHHRLKTFQKHCGFADWQIHDVRRTVVTGMNRIGIPPHVVECVVNHVSGFRAGVAGVYNRHPYEREMVQALQRWSEHVLALAEGRVDKVVPLRA